MIVLPTAHYRLGVHTSWYGARPVWHDGATDVHTRSRERPQLGGTGTGKVQLVPHWHPLTVQVACIVP